MNVTKKSTKTMLQVHVRYVCKILMKVTCRSLKDKGAEVGV